jgi:hypothetical protein
MLHHRPDRRRAAAERRARLERRQYTKAQTDDERRAPGERRSDDGRRRLVHGARVAAGPAAETAEDWLRTHCKGRWSMVRDDLGETPSILVLFEFEPDKQAFKTAMP